MSLKIALIANNDITSGGGFNQALATILSFQKICRGKHEIIVINDNNNSISYLELLGVQAVFFKLNIIDVFLAASTYNIFFQYIQSKLKLTGGLEKKLLSEKVDLAYFVTPSAQCLALKRINYISTVWDIAHTESPEFPEVRQHNIFYKRQLRLHLQLPPAFLTITDSEILSELVSRKYLLDKSRVIAIPFSPSPFLEDGVEDSSSKLELQLPDKYYFYPAQFWPHKNHYHIVKAVKILRDKGINLSVVFVGGDKNGHMEYIKSLVDKYGLSDLIFFMGFVSTSAMKELYEKCTAVVMPSYFGPTNIPPLEAWSLGKPLIYSKHLGKGFIKDAALLIDASSEYEIADAMLKVTDKSTSKKLIANGRKQLEMIRKERNEAEKSLLDKIDEFSNLRKCWK